MEKSAPLPIIYMLRGYDGGPGKAIVHRIGFWYRLPMDAMPRGLAGCRDTVENKPGRVTALYVQPSSVEVAEAVGQRVLERAVVNAAVDSNPHVELRVEVAAKIPDELDVSQTTVIRF